jgi:hypothetical protein
LVNEEVTVKLRLDVDYPYPSRTKSFVYLALGVKNRKSKDYLNNARAIARMVNESPKQVMAYWFFTPYTIPDKKLLGLLNPNRHEIALHVANKPFEEWKVLENKTNRTVKYYTIHGTSRLLAQLLWRRKIGQKQAKVPNDFPLISLHNFPTLSLDTERYKFGHDIVAKSAEDWIKHDVVLSLHPEWLFKQNKKNCRGPFYDVLKSILEVDKELDTLRVRDRFFSKITHDTQEYEKNIIPTGVFLEKLEDKGIDIFTFLERKWCCPIPNPPSTWIKEDDNVGLLEIKSYEDWWQSIGKKTRNMVRRAEKSGLKVSVVEPSDKLAEGIWKIYNETPIRQERAFSHFGESRQTVAGNMFAAKNNTFIGAYLQDELVGFIQILYGDNIAIISNILALQRHWDKAINNALLSKAVEVCVSKGVPRLMYGRIGNHPSLDRFKKNNGFLKSPITRYYIPLTNKGKLAIRLGLHRELKDSLPNFVKYPLIPAINWVSRTKVRVKLRLKKLK